MSYFSKGIFRRRLNYVLVSIGEASRKTTEKPEENICHRALDAIERRTNDKKKSSEMYRRNEQREKRLAATLIEIAFVIEKYLPADRRVNHRCRRMCNETHP